MNVKKEVVTAEDLSVESVKALYNGGSILTVAKLNNKNTFLAEVEVVYFGSSRAEFPFRLEMDFNLKNRVSFRRVRDKLKPPVFSEPPVISRTASVKVNNMSLAYCQLRAVNDHQCNVSKTIHFLRLQQWAGVVHCSMDDALKVYLLPTSSLTHELGITTDKFPRSLHALFVKKMELPPLQESTTMVEQLVQVPTLPGDHVAMEEEEDDVARLSLRPSRRGRGRGRAKPPRRGRQQQNNVKVLADAGVTGVRKRRAAAVKAQQGIKRLRLDDNRQDGDHGGGPRQPPTPFYKLSSVPGSETGSDEIRTASPSQARDDLVSGTICVTTPPPELMGDFDQVMMVISSQEMGSVVELVCSEEGDGLAQPFLEPLPDVGMAVDPELDGHLGVMMSTANIAQSGRSTDASDVGKVDQRGVAELSTTSSSTSAAPLDDSSGRRHPLPVDVQTQAHHLAPLQKAPPVVRGHGNGVLSGEPVPIPVCKPAPTQNIADGSHRGRSRLPNVLSPPPSSHGVPSRSDQPSDPRSRSLLGQAPLSIGRPPLPSSSQPRPGLPSSQANREPSTCSRIARMECRQLLHEEHRKLGLDRCHAGQQGTGKQEIVPAKRVPQRSSVTSPDESERMAVVRKVTLAEYRGRKKPAAEEEGKQRVDEASLSSSSRDQSDTLTLDTTPSAGPPFKSPPPTHGVVEPLTSPTSVPVSATVSPATSSEPSARPPTTNQPPSSVSSTTSSPAATPTTTQTTPTATETTPTPTPPISANSPAVVADRVSVATSVANDCSSTSVASVSLGAATATTITSPKELEATSSSAISAPSAPTVSVASVPPPCSTSLQPVLLQPHHYPPIPATCPPLPPQQQPPPPPGGSYHPQLPYMPYGQAAASTLPLPPPQPPPPPPPPPPAILPSHHHPLTSYQHHYPPAAAATADAGLISPFSPQQIHMQPYLGMSNLPPSMAAAPVRSSWIPPILPLPPQEFQKLQAEKLLEDSLAQQRKSRSPRRGSRSLSYSRSRSRSCSRSRSRSLSRSPSPYRHQSRHLSRRSRVRSYSRSPDRSRWRSRSLSSRSRSPVVRSHVGMQVSTKSESVGIQCQPYMFSITTQTRVFKRDRFIQTLVPETRNQAVQVGSQKLISESTQTVRPESRGANVQTDPQDRTAPITALLSTLTEILSAHPLSMQAVEEGAHWLETKLDNHIDEGQRSFEEDGSQYDLPLVSPLSGCSNISEGNWSDSHSEPSCGHGDSPPVTHAHSHPRRPGSARVSSSKLSGVPRSNADPDATGCGDAGSKELQEGSAKSSQQNDEKRSAVEGDVIADGSKQSNAASTLASENKVPCISSTGGQGPSEAVVPPLITGSGTAASSPVKMAMAIPFLSESVSSVQASPVTPTVAVSSFQSGRDLCTSWSKPEDLCELRVSSGVSSVGEPSGRLEENSSQNGDHTVLVEKLPAVPWKSTTDPHVPSDQENGDEVFQIVSSWQLDSDGDETNGEHVTVSSRPKLVFGKPERQRRDRNSDLEVLQQSTSAAEKNQFSVKGPEVTGIVEDSPPTTSWTGIDGKMTDSSGGTERSGRASGELEKQLNLSVSHEKSWTTRKAVGRAVWEGEEYAKPSSKPPLTSTSTLEGSSSAKLQGIRACSLPPIKIGNGSHSPPLLVGDAGSDEANQALSSSPPFPRRLSSKYGLTPSLAKRHLTAEEIIARVGARRMKMKAGEEEKERAENDDIQQETAMDTQTPLLTTEPPPCPKPVEPPRQDAVSNKLLGDSGRKAGTKINLEQLRKRVQEHIKARRKSASTSPTSHNPSQSASTRSLRKSLSHSPSHFLWDSPLPPEPQAAPPEPLPPEPQPAPPEPLPPEPLPAPPEPLPPEPIPAPPEPLPPEPIPAPPEPLPPEPIPAPPESLPPEPLPAPPETLLPEPLPAPPETLLPEPLPAPPETLPPESLPAPPEALPPEPLPIPLESLLPEPLPTLPEPLLPVPLELLPGPPEPMLEEPYLPAPLEPLLAEHLLTPQKPLPYPFPTEPMPLPAGGVLWQPSPPPLPPVPPPPDCVGDDGRRGARTDVALEDVDDIPVVDMLDSSPVTSGMEDSRHPPPRPVLALPHVPLLSAPLPSCLAIGPISSTATSSPERERTPYSDVQQSVSPLESSFDPPSSTMNEAESSSAIGGSSSHGLLEESEIVQVGQNVDQKTEEPMEFHEAADSSEQSGPSRVVSEDPGPNLMLPNPVASSDQPSPPSSDQPSLANLDQPRLAQSESHSIGALEQPGLGNLVQADHPSRCSVSSPTEPTSVLAVPPPSEELCPASAERSSPTSLTAMEEVDAVNVDETSLSHSDLAGSVPPEHPGLTPAKEACALAAEHGGLASSQQIDLGSPKDTDLGSSKDTNLTSSLPESSPPMPPKSIQPATHIVIAPQPASDQDDVLSMSPSLLLSATDDSSEKLPAAEPTRDSRLEDASPMGSGEIGQLADDVGQLGVAVESAGTSQSALPGAERAIWESVPQRSSPGTVEEVSEQKPVDLTVDLSSLSYEHPNGTADTRDVNELSLVSSEDQHHETEVTVQKPGNVCDATVSGKEEGIFDEADIHSHRALPSSHGLLAVLAEKIKALPAEALPAEALSALLHEVGKLTVLPGKHDEGLPEVKRHPPTASELYQVKGEEGTCSSVEPRQLSVEFATQEQQPLELREQSPPNQSALPEHSFQQEDESGGDQMLLEAVSDEKEGPGSSEPESSCTPGQYLSEPVESLSAAKQSPTELEQNYLDPKLLQEVDESGMSDPGSHNLKSSWDMVEAEERPFEPGQGSLDPEEETRSEARQDPAALDQNAPEQEQVSSEPSQGAPLELELGLPQAFEQGSPLASVEPEQSLVDVRDAGLDATEQGQAENAAGTHSSHEPKECSPEEGALHSLESEHERGKEPENSSLEECCRHHVHNASTQPPVPVSSLFCMEEMPDEIDACPLKRGLDVATVGKESSKAPLSSQTIPGSDDEVSAPSMDSLPGECCHGGGGEGSGGAVATETSVQETDMKSVDCQPCESGTSEQAPESPGQSVPVADREDMDLSSLSTTSEGGLSFLPCGASGIVEHQREEESESIMPSDVVPLEPRLNQPLSVLGEDPSNLSSLSKTSSETAFCAGHSVPEQEIRSQLTEGDLSDEGKISPTDSTGSSVEEKSVSSIEQCRGCRTESDISVLGTSPLPVISSISPPQSPCHPSPPSDPDHQSSLHGEFRPELPPSPATREDSAPSPATREDSSPFSSQQTCLGLAESSTILPSLVIHCVPQRTLTSVSGSSGDQNADEFAHASSNSGDCSVTEMRSPPMPVITDETDNSHNGSSSLELISSPVCGNSSVVVSPKMSGSNDLDLPLFIESTLRSGEVEQLDASVCHRTSPVAVQGSLFVQNGGVDDAAENLLPGAVLPISPPLPTSVVTTETAPCSTLADRSAGSVCEEENKGTFSDPSTYCSTMFLYSDSTLLRSPTNSEEERPMSRCDSASSLSYSSCGLSLHLSCSSREVSEDEDEDGFSFGHFGYKESKGGLVPPLAEDVLGVPSGRTLKESDVCPSYAEMSSSGHLPAEHGEHVMEVSVGEGISRQKACSASLEGDHYGTSSEENTDWRPGSLDETVERTVSRPQDSLQLAAIEPEATMNSPAVGKRGDESSGRCREKMASGGARDALLSKSEQALANPIHCLDDCLDASEEGSIDESVDHPLEKRLAPRDATTSSSAAGARGNVGDHTDGSRRSSISAGCRASTLVCVESEPKNGRGAETCVQRAATGPSRAGPACDLPVTSTANISSLPLTGDPVSPSGPVATGVTVAVGDRYPTDGAHAPSDTTSVTTGTINVPADATTSTTVSMGTTAAINVTAATVMPTATNVPADATTSTTVSMGTTAAINVTTSTVMPTATNVPAPATITLPTIVPTSTHTPISVSISVPTSAAVSTIVIVSSSTNVLTPTNGPVSSNIPTSIDALALRSIPSPTGTTSSVSLASCIPHSDANTAVLSAPVPYLNLVGDLEDLIVIDETGVTKPGPSLNNSVVCFAETVLTSVANLSTISGGTPRMSSTSSTLGDPVESQQALFSAPRAGLSLPLAGVSVASRQRSHFSATLNDPRTHSSGGSPATNDAPGNLEGMLITHTGTSGRASRSASLLSPGGCRCPPSPPTSHRPLIDASNHMVSPSGSHFPPPLPRDSLQRRTAPPMTESIHRHRHIHPYDILYLRHLLASRDHLPLVSSHPPPPPLPRHLAEASRHRSIYNSPPLRPLPGRYPPFHQPMSPPPPWPQRARHHPFPSLSWPYEPHHLLSHSRQLSRLSGSELERFRDY